MSVNNDFSELDFQANFDALKKKKLPLSKKNELLMCSHYLVHLRGGLAKVKIYLNQVSDPKPSCSDAALIRALRVVEEHHVLNCKRRAVKKGLIK